MQICIVLMKSKWREKISITWTVHEKTRKPTNQKTSWLSKWPNQNPSKSKWWGTVSVQSLKLFPLKRQHLVRKYSGLPQAYLGRFRRSRPSPYPHHGLSRIYVWTLPFKSFYTVVINNSYIEGNIFTMIWMVVLETLPHGHMKQDV